MTEVVLPSEAVLEFAALSGRHLPLLRQWVADRPDTGVPRALLACAEADTLGEEELKAEMAVAFEAAKAENGRAASLVYGIFLTSLRQHRLAAEHLVRHFADYPGDEVAGLLLGVFHASGDASLQRAGETLVEQQYQLMDSQSWAWASWLSWVRAEQGRPDEAIALSEHALALFPRAGVAVHARAHADHDLGVGGESVARMDGWLAANPEALQMRHLNWHAALQCIASGDFSQARRRADEALQQSDVGMRAATNWRLLLAGQSPACLSELDHVRELLASPKGMADTLHTFNLALALACEGAVEDMQRLATTAERDEREVFREVLAPVVRALAAVCTGEHTQAVTLLEPLDHAVDRLGGVRVEREIVQDTLARALAESGQGRRAAALLEHRTTLRTHHRYEDLLLATQPAGALPGPRPALAPVPA
ncbi:hypothetical protein [Streptomyces sp. MBT27]|uniref:hypothetical protein n=1 Tax=Streptomyces sp. MBT27 TaxID=1488356 RepID=UPI001F07ABD7|nr:hypothetical protein [Streptomyces sp. MBT27]